VVHDEKLTVGISKNIFFYHLILSPSPYRRRSKGVFRNASVIVGSFIYARWASIIITDVE